MLVSGSARVEVQGVGRKILVQVLYGLAALWPQNVDDVTSKSDELHGIGGDVGLSWCEVVGGEALLCCMV